MYNYISSCILSNFALRELNSGVKHWADLMLEGRKEVFWFWRSTVSRGLVIRVAIVLEIRIFNIVSIFVLDLVLSLLIQEQELHIMNFFFPLNIIFHGTAAEAAAAKYQPEDNAHYKYLTRFITLFDARDFTATAIVRFPAESASASAFLRLREGRRERVDVVLGPAQRLMSIYPQNIKNIKTQFFLVLKYVHCKLSINKFCC